MRLGAVMADWRWANRISLRDAARMIGVNYHTLHRFEIGKGIDARCFLAILNWLTKNGRIRRKRRED